MRLVSFLLILAIATPSGADVFSNDDIFRMEIANDPQVSPDGTQVAYVRQGFDIMTDRRTSDIWIVDTDGNNHRPLLVGSENFSSPRWSPGGDRIAYVSNVEDRGSQIHVRWMDSGQTAIVTNVRGGPSSLSWSPDGDSIAFEMFVKGESASLAKQSNKPKDAEWAPPVTVVDQMQYRADGAGFLQPGYSHLFVVPADGGSPRQLTQGDYFHGGPIAWTPDGRRGGS